MRSTTLLTILLILTSISHAQLGDRLSQLQETYDKEVARVTAPIDAKYHKALIKLQKSLIEVNELEEALEVKKEIESLIAKRQEEKPDMASTESASPPPTSEQDSEWQDDWRGDLSKRDDEGKPMFLIRGNEGGTRKISKKVDVLKKYPNGVRMRFKYKSEGLDGGGVEIRGDHPSAGFTYRNPTLTYDGQWHEYEWPFPDYKGDEEITFEILVENTDGELMVSDIEFIAM